MILRISLYVVVFIVFVLVVGPAIVNRAIFPAPMPSYTWHWPGVVNIGTAEAPIAAYWVANPYARKVILFSHGNGEDIGMFDRFFHILTSGAECSLLAYDYPGYGLTKGTPTEQSVYDTAEAAYRFLVEEQKFAPEDIVVMGRSLGGGPASYLAEKYPVGGLILESTFTSAPRVKTGIRILPYDPFPNITRIARITCPKLIIHGAQDEIIPFSHARRLAAAATPPCHLEAVEGAGHNDLFWVCGQENYIHFIREFLKEQKPKNRYLEKDKN